MFSSSGREWDVLRTGEQWCYGQAAVGKAVEVTQEAGWGLLAAKWLPLSESKGGLGWISSGVPRADALHPEGGSQDVISQVCSARARCWAQPSLPLPLQCTPPWSLTRIAPSSSPGPRRGKLQTTPPIARQVVLAGGVHPPRSTAMALGSLPVRGCPCLPSWPWRQLLLVLEWASPFLVSSQ